MKLYWRKAKFFGNVSVPDLQGLVNLQDENMFTRFPPKKAGYVTPLFSFSFLSVSWQLTDFPFTHSVAKELEAMADPQPKVLNRASTIFPFSSTWICKQHEISPTLGYSLGVMAEAPALFT